MAEKDPDRYLVFNLGDEKGGGLECALEGG